MKTLIAMTTATLIAAGAGQAAAQVEPGPPKASVSYADLDLSHASGRAVLEGRIAGAVRRVCPAAPLPVQLREQQLYRACRVMAWSSARQQLAALYNGRKFAEASIRVTGAPD